MKLLGRKENVVKLKASSGKRVNNETEIKKQAFEYYVKLGPERSYMKVAEHFGISNVTIGRWANVLDWETRLFKVLESADKKAFNKLSGSLSNVINKTTGKAVEEIMESVKKLFKDIKDQNKEARKYNKLLPEMIAKNEVPKDTKPMKELRLINNLSEMELGFKLARLLAGETTNKTEQVVSGTVSKEMEELLERDPEARQLVAELYRKQFYNVNNATGENR